MKKLKVLELFGGIGAPRKALERLNIDCEIVDYVEIDKFAVKSYNAIFNENYEPQDILTWDKDLKVDMIFHGSPCQDFSLAGKQAGGDKDSGTRSSLMYETIRIVSKLKPKYVIWENVKNVISKKHKHTFDNYLHEMELLGYTNYYQVLNAKDYGIPQNRERVFTVSILKEKTIYDDYNSSVRKDQDTIGTLTCNCGSSAIRNGWKIIECEQNFTFPPKQDLKLRLKDMLEDEVDEKYYLTESNIKTINRNFGSKGKVLNLNEFSLIEKMTYPSRINQKINETIVPTLTSAMGTGGGNVPVVVKNQGKEIVKKTEIANTLMARDYKGFGNQEMTGVCKNTKIRKLTPKECWRLMGFDDADFEKAATVCSDSQLYKQAGNSIVVNVLERIFENLLG